MDKLKDAKAVYKTLCQTLDNMKWRYNKEEDRLIIRTAAVGDDLTMNLFFCVDADRQVMYLKSPMPFPIPASMHNTMAKAILLANYYMLNGSFEFDYSDGYLAFKIVVPFMESIISEAVCKYMIIVACNMTDKFNDKFQDVATGRMTIEAFEAFVNNG